jgi:hypothetical protein
MGKVQKSSDFDLNISWRQHEMKVNDELQAPTTLPPTKELRY